MPNYNRYKLIVVSKPNYEKLKELGQAGDSFNDVINNLLKQETGAKNER